MTAMVASGPSTEERVTTFVDDLVRVHSTEEDFNIYLVHKEATDKAAVDHTEEQWISILKDAATSAGGDGASGSQMVEVALRVLVQFMSTQKNPRTLNVIRGLLDRSVLSGVVTSRQVCDSLLGSDGLRHDNAAFWISVFKLVRRLVGGVDYKGVREIMKVCIDKVAALPVYVDNERLAPQLKVVKDLLSYIFDRNAALLPGYFIVNEILKSYPENRSWPHWSLVPLVSSFLNSFRHTAQMVTSINRHRMKPVVEQAGKAHVVSTWKLDPNSLKFLLKGTLTYERILPYSKEVVEPQKELVAYILREPYSKELVNSILGLQKPRKELTGAAANQMRHAVLEEQLVHVFLHAMQEAEVKDSEDLQVLWRNISSELIFFILFQCVNFATFVESLSEQIRSRRLEAGRDDLMWALLQYISGSIAKNPTAEFVPVLELFSLYAAETQPLPVPDTTLPDSVRKLSAAAIYIHLNNRAQSDGFSLQFSLPASLQLHYEFLMGLGLGLSEMNVEESLQHDYVVPIACNTFSSNQELFQWPLTGLCRAIGAHSELEAATAMPGPTASVSDLKAQAPVEPLSLDLLDSLSVHTKMSLIHSIVTYINKQVTSRATAALSPGLVETYARLLVYTEIESLWVKGFLHQLMPQVFKNSMWGVLHTLLEIISYRLHHIHANFRLSLLSNLQVGFVGGSHPILSKHAQLNLTIESATLRLITGLGNADISPPKAPSVAGAPQQAAKMTTVLYGDSEELNRAVVLTLARSIHINGLEQQSAQWIKEVLTNIMQKTPHSWPTHTLQNFPTILQEFFKDNPGPKENKSQLKLKLEEEHKLWTSQSSDLEKLQHFSTQSNSLFLCVLWKTLLETDQIHPLAFKVVERIGPKQLMSHLRSFCDVLVYEFSKSGRTGHVNKCIEATNNLIWKHNMIAIDRLILCMSLRTNEGNEAQVCFFIIQLLLLKPTDFRNRVNELVATISPEHYLTKDFHKAHLELHQKYPERFFPEECVATQQQLQPDQINPFSTLPIYFGNVCLRFIAVFDIVVHRFLELPPIAKSLETLLDHFGVLYKFHDKPITYLYNTLHYYEKRIRERPTLKKKLISRITGALREIRPVGWCLTSDYLDYLAVEEPAWTPPVDYYVRLVGRFTHAVQGRNPFPQMDWRFNEFPNEGAHALYVTCIEIMGLPVEPVLVGAALLDVILECDHIIPRQELPDWINSIGLLMSTLPDAYWEGLYQRLVTALSSAPLTNWMIAQSPFKLFNFDEAAGECRAHTRLRFLLAVAHSVYHHAGFSQIQTLPDLVREKLLPVIKTEEQLLFVLHLTGPFLQRLHSERYMRPLFDLTVQYYRILLKVDKESQPQPLKYMDEICDILYHVKYQFTGDSVRQDAERVVRELSAPLQLRLRFIAPGIIAST